MGKSVQAPRQLFIFALDVQVLAHDIHRAAFDLAKAAAHPQARMPKVMLPDTDAELFGEILQVLI